MRRRRPRASFVLALLGVLLALSSTLVLQGHIRRLSAAAAAGGPTASVAVAAVSLARGTVIEPGMLRASEMPMAHRPPGAVGSPADVAGAVLSADLAAREVLTESRLAGKGGPVAALVPDGFRATAVTVAVPPGSVVAGDRVDLLSTFATGNAHTEVVLEEAEILAVMPGPEGELAAATTLVLLVTPDQAERVAYARAFADLSVSIAGPIATP